MYAILANILLGFGDYNVLKCHTICYNVHNHFQVQKMYILGLVFMNILTYHVGHVTLYSGNLQPDHSAAQLFKSRFNHVLF
jgi:hypothetical protein